MKSKFSSTSDPINELVAKVMGSARYSNISEALVRRIATQELEKRRDWRQVVKATKNKLHQVGGAYLDRPVDYNGCLGEMNTAFLAGKEEFLRVCQRVMCYHSSTRERLPEIDRFYSILLSDLQPVQSVLDVACGLHPLAIPWMGLPEGVEYFAVDIFSDMITFINRFFSLAGVHGSAVVGDVIGNFPTYPVDIAFVLKTLPCLEQVDKSAGVRLLDSLQAKHIIVSFPVHSLGGRRDKGMLENYASQFYAITKDRDWCVKRHEYQTELVFVVSV